MSPIKHAAISGVIGLGLAIYLKSWGAGVACLLSGIFVDVDHHLDFIIAKRRFP